jgi:hypothetical protein
MTGAILTERIDRRESANKGLKMRKPTKFARFYVVSDGTDDGTHVTDEKGDELHVQQILLSCEPGKPATLTFVIPDYHREFHTEVHGDHKLMGNIAILR